MYHTLDVYPRPKGESPLFVNEPWLTDGYLASSNIPREPDDEEDNIRVYVPMDINKKAVLRNLYRLIVRYGEANERNEVDFQSDVGKLVAEIEIYDQIWYVRHMPETGDHSAEGIELVREFVSMLEDIPDGCAECFPFMMIDELRNEYLK